MQLIQLALAFVLLLSIASGDTVTSFALNQQEGQIYAITATNWLIELDNVAVQQNNAHHLDASPDAISDSAHVKVINGKRSLFVSEADGITTKTQIRRYDTPFNNRPLLSSSARSPNATGFGFSIFNDQDLLILTLAYHELYLFNMQDLSLLDSVNVFSGLRRGFTSVVYNQKTDVAVVFWYIYGYSSHLTQPQVSEYKVVNSKLVEAPTTFPQESAQFNNSQLVSSAFDASSNHYYALDSLTPRLVKFNSNNLAVFSFISLGNAKFINTGTPIALYNFGAQLAYVISSNTARNGYRLQEVDLTTGTIRRSQKFDTNGHTAASAFLDTTESNLYIGLHDSPTQPPTRTNATIAVVSLANFQQQLIVLQLTL